MVCPDIANYAPGRLPSGFRLHGCLPVCGVPSRSVFSFQSFVPMKIRLALPALFLAVGALVAADSKTSAPTESEIIAKLRPSYPLKTCIVTGDELSPDAIDFLYRTAGKPDRLVRFCCDGCIDDFKAEPAKYLKKIDDAAKAPTPAVPAAKRKS